MAPGRGGPAVAASGLLALLAALMSLGGCAGSVHRAGSAPTTTVALVPPADPDGAVTVAVGAQPTNWNVHSAAGDAPTMRAVIDPVWPSVWHVAPDGSLHLDTTFVSSATVTSLDPETVEYRINPEAVWSDGVAITYRDFVYAVQAERAPTAADPAGYSDVASVGEVGADADEVRVVLSRPDPDWQALFATLVPAHVAERVGFSAGFTDPVADDVSGGPFLVQAYDPGTSVTEVRNPRYWGPPAALASVTFRFLTEPGEAAPALAAGQVDAALVAPGAPGSGVSGGLGGSGSGSGTGSGASGATGSGGAGGGGVTVARVDSDTYEDLAFDQRNRWLRDPAIRQAISLAVDRPALVAATVGRSDPSVVPLDNHLFVPGELGYTDDSGNLYDGAQDAKALQVLQGAGYGATDGVLRRDGVAVTLGVSVDRADAVGTAVAAALVGELGAIGVTVTVADEPAGSLVGALHRGDFDLAVTEVDVSPYLSEEDAAYRTADAATGAGSRNYDAFTDRSVDALLTRAAAVFDAGARRMLYARVDAELWRDDADLPLFCLPETVATAVTIGGLAPDPGPEGPTWDMAGWSVPASS